MAEAHSGWPTVPGYSLADKRATRTVQIVEPVPGDRSADDVTSQQRRRDEDGEDRRSGMLERHVGDGCISGGCRLARLEDVADEAGLPRSTVSRIVRQLVALDWLTRMPSSDLGSSTQINASQSR
jgi:hypothetical protein